MTNRFEGRTVVVTGGYGTAERLIAEGATVSIVGRRQAELTTQPLNWDRPRTRSRPM